jgi:hypothetical protein
MYGPWYKPNQGVEKLYNKNYKTLKKTPEDGKTAYCLWIGRINTMKMTVLPKAIHRFIAMLIKFQLLS